MDNPAAFWLRILLNLIGGEILKFRWIQPCPARILSLVFGFGFGRHQPRI